MPPNNPTSENFTPNELSKHSMPKFGKILFIIIFTTIGVIALSFGIVYLMKYLNEQTTKPQQTEQTIKHFKKINLQPTLDRWLTTQINKKNNSKNRNNMGFILYSTLISMTISVIVLTILLGIVFYAVMWDAKLLDSVAMMEDGRYTRRMVVAQMIWNPVKVTVEDHNKSLYIHDTKRTTLTVQRHALYRKLTDSSLQPVSGSRIVGTTDKRNVGYTQEYPFSVDTNGTVYLRWYINNRFVNDRKYTSGYGGLTIYEVSIGQSAIYDWYKSKEETSYEHRSP